MNKKLFLAAAIFFTLNSLSAQFSPGCFALKDVNVIDGVNDKVLANYTIIVLNGKIETIGPVNAIQIPDTAVVFNGKGKYVIPGLIDAHVHLLTDVSNADYRARAEHDSKAMLLSGITSVRDMAGDARSLASLARDAIVGDIDAPDIYYVSLMAGPAQFGDPRGYQATRGGVPGKMFYLRAVTDSTDIPMAIAEARGTGATAIKLYAELSGSLAKKITDEAHRQGMQVWSHADLTIASPLEVINAGVNTISHASMIALWMPGRIDSIPPAWLLPNRNSVFWDQQLKLLPVDGYIVAMKKNNTILDPTLLIYKELMMDTSLTARRKSLMTALYELGKRFTKLALDNGIRICTGTDVDEDRFVQREMKILVTDAGFTPMQAIISATMHGAMAIGIENKTGSIEKGKDADMVLLAANPAIDINNLDKVEIVIKKGKLYNPK